MSHAPFLSIPLIGIILPCVLQAQSQPATSTPHVKASHVKNQSLRLTPRQKEGLKILRSQTEVAKGLTPAMSTEALFEIARGYESIDKARSLRILNDAFNASKTIEDDESTRQIKAALQSRILQQMVAVDPPSCERLLGGLSGVPLKQAVTALLRKYTREKQFSRAITVLGQLREEEFPYIAASQLVDALPATMSAERQSLFTQALSSFSQHDHKGDPVASDFATLLSRTWEKLPPTLVLQAVDEILQQAHDADTNMSITVGATNGAASFSSSYEYAIFVTLPILRELDPGRADDLLQQCRDLKSINDRFPHGLGTPDTITMRMSDTGEQSANDRYRIEVQSRADKIINEADRDPKQALAALMSLPDFDDARLLALLNFARAMSRTAPHYASEALAESLKLIPSVKEMFNRGQQLVDVAELYLKLGDAGNEKDVIDRGFKVAEELYAADTDANDPNQAFKAAWPCAVIWRKLLSVVARSSTADALQQISKIPDPDIQSLETIAIADTLLGTTPDVDMVVVKTNNKNNYMMVPE